MLKRKTYEYFLYLILFLTISLVVFWFADLAIDINVHDTYYVIHYSVIITILLIPVAFFAILYWLLTRVGVKLIKNLTKIHTVITLIGSVLFVLIISLYDFISQLFNNSPFSLFDDTDKKNIILTVLFLLIVIAQIAFIINIIVSLAKYFLQKSKLKN